MYMDCGTKRAKAVCSLNISTSYEVFTLFSLFYTFFTCKNLPEQY